MSFDPNDPAIEPLWRAGYAAGYDAGKAVGVSFSLGWGKPCAKCGEPVHPPLNRTEKAAFGFGDKIWHGRCAPEGPISGTFTVGA